MKKKPVVKPIPDEVPALRIRMDSAERDILELMHDLKRIVRLMDVHFGSEFAQAAKEILEKYQGPVP